MTGNFGLDGNNERRGESHESVKTAEERAERKRRKKERQIQEKEEKRRRKQGLGSSMVESSMMDSSMLDDGEARGLMEEVEEGIGAPLEVSTSRESDEGQMARAEDEEREEPVLELPNGVDTEEVQEEAEHLNGADAEEVLEDPVQKKSRKSSRVASNQSRLKRLESDSQASVVPADPIQSEEQSQDTTAVSKKGKLAKDKKGKKTKSKKSAIAAEETPAVEDSDAATSLLQSQSADLSQLPDKIKKAKRKARLSSQNLSQDTPAALHTEDDPTAILHQPHIPAHNNHPSPRITQEEIAEAEAQIQSSAWSDAPPASRSHEDEDSEQPSQKALGKRKASETALRAQENKKRRGSKDKATGTPSLNNFGFLSQDETREAAAGNNKRGSRSQPEAVGMSEEVEDASRDRRSRSASNHISKKLGGIAANMFASQIDSERSSPPSSQPRLSSSHNLTSSQQRRATPMFTPINRRKPTATAATVDPTDFELPPSSQPRQEYQPESQEPPPKSSERPKRRLPTGEPQPESSQAKRKSKTPASKNGVSQTPNPKTPKSPKSSSKTPRTQGTPMTKGSRLPDDDARAIADAVEEYRDSHDMTQVELNAMIQEDAAKAENKEFWTYMTEELPSIPKTKVLNQCRRKFHNFDRGSWTEEQDQELRDAHERNPGKWKQIGGELNRFAEDCRDRWRNYVVCGDRMRKDVWDKAEEEKFKEVVEDCVSLVREFKQQKLVKPADAGKDDYSLIDWKLVSEKMNYTRSRLQCIKKWKKLQEREATDDEDEAALLPVSETAWRLAEAERIARIINPGLKLELLYAVRDSKAGSESKIPWKLIQRELDAMGKKMALKVCFRNLMEHIDYHEDMKIQDIVSALIDAYETSAPNEPDGFDDFRSSARKLKRRRSVSTKKSRSEAPGSTTKKGSISKAAQDEGNGEGPSTHKTRQSKGRKAALLEEMDHDNDESPVPKKKLRSRMKAQDQSQSQSQETNSPAESSDGINTAFQAVKTKPFTGKSPRVAKRPLTSARTSKRLSATQVVEESEEEATPQLAVEGEPKRGRALRRGEHVQRELDVQPDESDQQDDTLLPAEPEHQPEADDQIDNNTTQSYDDGDDAPLTNGHAPESEEEEEDYVGATHDQESVDLDEPHSITANGFHDHNSDYDDDDDEEVPRAREESVDLDTPARLKRIPKRMRFSEDEEDGDGNGKGNGLLGREGSVSTDASVSSIAATPMVKKAPSGLRDTNGNGSEDSGEL